MNVVAGELKYPPPHIPRVDEEQDEVSPLATVKSPKSIPFPSEAIVIYSMIFVDDGA